MTQEHRWKHCLNYGGSKNYFGKLTFSKTVTFGAIFERRDLFGG